MEKSERAKQFLPFDSLKGLQEALRVKEYEHERTKKGDLSEDLMEKISNNLLLIDGSTRISVKYFVDGYYKVEEGIASINFEKEEIYINNINISFSDIFNLDIL